MPPTFTGDRTGPHRRIAIVVSRFSKVARGGKTIGEILLEGCQARLAEAGVKPDAVDVVWVPGAFEIPVAADALLRSRGTLLDAVIALGCVVRGDTPHFDYVAGESARGIMAVACTHGVPVLNGILTCDTEEQALERAGGAAGHKGVEAADAALEMASVLERVRKAAPKA
jgi:6,7-dimethyl-8-ribityllumazine synthase